MVGPELSEFIDLQTEELIRTEYEILHEQAEDNFHLGEQYNIEADNCLAEFNGAANMGLGQKAIINFFRNRWLARKQYKLGYKKEAEAKQYYELVDGADTYLQGVSHGNN